MTLKDRIEELRIQRKLQPLKDLGIYDAILLLIKTVVDSTVELWLRNTSVGLKGDKGDAGDVGEKGDPGRDGKDGLPGKDGIDGKDGAPGKDGRDGRDGKNGLDGPVGPKGDPGKDGSPDTPDQVFDKLLQAGKQVPSSFVAGLTEEFANLRTAIREKRRGGGGGGMGQPQHETKAVSSASTTITTDYPIAAGGRAIFPMSYQGQMLMYGTHYTVGGDRKTITLLFVPQDSTFIDITYVR